MNVEECREYIRRHLVAVYPVGVMHYQIMNSIRYDRKRVSWKNLFEALEQLSIEGDVEMYKRIPPGRGGQRKTWVRATSQAVKYMEATQ